ncbi:MAG: hypothetical protein Tsb0032_36870 [Kiloniellaceae bacterium]
MKRMTSLVMLGVLAAPLPAFADCAARIAAVENSPAFAEPAPMETAADKDTAAAETDAASNAPASGEEERVVKEEVVGDGTAVRENGGETVYQEGGPATPRENWFVSEKHELAVLEHLDTAKGALESGDEKACLEAIEEAEKGLRPEEG